MEPTVFTRILRRELPAAISKTTDGGLVMLQRLYHCYGECSLDRRWRRWEPARGAIAK